MVINYAHSFLYAGIKKNAKGNEFELSLQL